MPSGRITGQMISCSAGWIKVGSLVGRLAGKGEEEKKGVVPLQIYWREDNDLSEA